LHPYADLVADLAIWLSAVVRIATVDPTSGVSRCRFASHCGSLYESHVMPDASCQTRVLSGRSIPIVWTDPISAMARAQYDAVIAVYRQTTLTAFQQVEDNLAALSILEREAQQQDEAVESAQNNLRIFTAAISVAGTTTSRSLRLRLPTSITSATGSRFDDDGWMPPSCW
jgi:hypothetical protein